jgi:hypothetical protein
MGSRKEQAPETRFFSFELIALVALKIPPALIPKGTPPAVDKTA